MADGPGDRFGKGAVAGFIVCALVLAAFLAAVYIDVHGWHLHGRR